MSAFILRINYLHLWDLSYCHKELHGDYGWMVHVHSQRSDPIFPDVQLAVVET